MKPDLYKKALEADERFDRTIATQFPGKTRWTITAEEMKHPELQDKYRAKVEADRAWLDSMREPAQEEQPKGMTVEESRAHLAQRAKEGAFGLSWNEIERAQGGKLNRNA